MIRSALAVVVLAVSSLAACGQSGPVSPTPTPNAMATAEAYVAARLAERALTRVPTATPTRVPTPSPEPTNIRKLSVSEAGQEGDDFGFLPSVSAQGRYVAFESGVSDLVEGDSNGVVDVFVYDLKTDRVRRVSISSNGRQANDASMAASLSADGRYVAFDSKASDLVEGDSNGRWDVFVHDLVGRETRRVSVSSKGSQGDGDRYLPSFSADGRFVAFRSDAAGLVDADTNGFWDIYVHELETGRTHLVSVSNGGHEANHNSHMPSISADGRFVAFKSEASNLVDGDTNGTHDIFVRDLRARQTQLVSISSDGDLGDGYSDMPRISADGGSVAFRSAASNLVQGDTNAAWDIFVHELRTGSTSLASVSSQGEQGRRSSGMSSISANGRFVAFRSLAPNLVEGKANRDDIYVAENPLAVEPNQP